jgi:L-lactate dehydrogenase complex protein LldG
MKVSDAKEQILKRIRKGLNNKVQQPFPNIDGQTSIYSSNHQSLEVQFAKSFTDLGGNFVYCDDVAEFVTNFKNLIAEKGWKDLVCWDTKLLEMFEKNNFETIRNTKQIAEIEPCDAGITTCETLVARTGTITLSSKQQSGRVLGIYPPIHIVVAFSEQVVNDLKDSLMAIKQKYPEQIPSLINFETGPSRTADIEKTLVVGVHGPKEVFVFLIDEAII